MNVWRHFKPLVLKKKSVIVLKIKTFGYMQLFSMVGGGVLINSVNKYWPIFIHMDLVLSRGLK